MIILRGGALFVAAMFVQWWCDSRLVLGGAVPQVLFALTVLVAARRGPLAGMLLGYAWGLYADTLRADLFGANALLYAWAGYAAGMIRRQLDLRAAGPLTGTTVLLSWAYVFGLGALGQVFLKSFPWGGWMAFLLVPFLNAAVAVLAAAAWDAKGDA